MTLSPYFFYEFLDFIRYNVHFENDGIVLLRALYKNNDSVSFIYKSSMKRILSITHKRGILKFPLC